MLSKRHQNKTKAKFIGIDIEKDMIKFANKNKKMNTKFINSNVVKYKLQKSDLIISYYTTQFVRPSDRQLLFNKIYLKFLLAKLPAVFIEPRCIKSEPSPSIQTVCFLFDIEYPSATDEV